MRNLAVSLALGAILLPSLAGAKDKKKDVPVAPLPTVIVNAKKIFLSNGGGSKSCLRCFLFKDERMGQV